MNFFLFLSLSLPAFASSGDPLWKEWYLVSQNGAPISFFEETAERRKKEEEIAITQRWVEKISERVETYIGSVSRENDLSPIAFFVEHKGGTPYKTDGRAKEKRMEITFKPGTPDLAKSTEYAPLTSNTYLSSAIPMVISRQLTKGKGAFEFTAIVEDGGKMNVEVKKGSVSKAIGRTQKNLKPF